MPWHWRTIVLTINNLNPIWTDVLVVDSQLLGFDMLFGMDIMKILGGISIIQSSEAIFNWTDPPACIAIRIEELDFSIIQSSEAIFNWTDPPACIAIRIEELDFSTEFNEQTRVWTASWK